MPAQEHDELARLAASLRRMTGQDTFALAYSGGLDSRFLAFAARKLGFSPLLLHIRGPHVPQEETDSARAWARSEGLPYEEITMDPLALPLVAAGDRRRCYACKHALFSGMLGQTALPLCDGTNASDTGGYRPGLQALRELHVLSPLADAGLGKPAIHRLAAELGMDAPDQKPRPCLLTRLPYGMPPTRECLEQLERGEQAIRECLASAGLDGTAFRLRIVAPGRMEVHMETGARASLPPTLLQALAARAGHGVADGAPLPVVFMDRLSGFFDRLPAR